MTSDFTNYLAANVLNDLNIVTYRSLSMAIKVHNNTAKRMLYDFHSRQNGKRPGSVHATYLISGIQTNRNEITNNGILEKDEEDAPMQSSPFMSSSVLQPESEEAPSRTQVMTLTREEHLEAVKAKYDRISSLHIYSLEPSSIECLQILSDMTREIFVTHANEDPMVEGKQYGVIQNLFTKRRTGRKFVPPATQAAVQQANTIKAVKVVLKTGNLKSGETSPSTEQLGQLNVKQEPSKDAAKNVAPKLTGLKREQSDIFKSFGKPKPKLRTEGTGNSTETSAGASTPQSDAPNIPPDEFMKDVSEEEQEEDFIPQPNNDKPSQRKSKSEREEQLRKMMEDEEIEISPDELSPESENSQPADALPAHEETLTEAPEISAGARRRGRRKVIKKKMIKDEEGYLVTKEEPAWESFSEDEPLPPPLKTKMPASSATTSTAKTKKMGAKPGQGNIMSFFGKK